MSIGSTKDAFEFYLRAARKSKIKKGKIGKNNSFKKIKKRQPKNFKSVEPEPIELDSDKSVSSAR